MARQDMLGWIGSWADGDNPGDGPQNADSDGLNGNWWKIGQLMDVLFQLPYNALKSHIIGPSQLKGTVVDGQSLVQDATTKKLKVKDAGVARRFLADKAVAMENLKNSIAGLGLAKTQVTGLELNPDESTLTVASNTLQVKNTVTGLIYPDNSIDTDEKVMCGTKLRRGIVFGFSSTGWGVLGGLACSDNLGVPMPEHGYIRSIWACDSNATVTHTDPPTIDAWSFRKGAFLSVLLWAFDSCVVAVNGHGTAVVAIDLDYLPALITVEVEFIPNKPE